MILQQEKESISKKYSQLEKELVVLQNFQSNTKSSSGVNGLPLPPAVQGQPQQSQQPLPSTPSSKGLDSSHGGSNNNLIGEDHSSVAIFPTPNQRQRYTSSSSSGLSAAVGAGAGDIEKNLFHGGSADDDHQNQQLITMEEDYKKEFTGNHTVIVQIWNLFR